MIDGLILWLAKMQIPYRQNEESRGTPRVHISTQKTSWLRMCSKCQQVLQSWACVLQLSYLGDWNSVSRRNTLYTSVSWRQRYKWGAGEKVRLRGSKEENVQKEGSRGSHQLPTPPAPARRLWALRVREPWQGRPQASAFPTLSSLSRRAFCKSFKHAHIFSHDRGRADGDLHPTITDEICIDSKIKSNEKKIGSQPDPTVPDCCIEVAKRHFFLLSPDFN